MKKLLLTSTGFSNPIIGKEFLELVGKEPNEIKVLFIPTAARTSEEKCHVDESRKELVALGILPQNVIDCTLKKPLGHYDAFYVCGGNTFYLLYQLRASGFDRQIKEDVANGKVYVGVSAGSIIAGPEIGIAAPFDENDIQIKDITGLGLTDIIVSPHYCDKEKEIIQDYVKKTEYKVIPLTDQQALCVIGTKVRLIS
ncbi:Type 1 glutamine amidotransferase-like domain-containing protein [Candidatus Woesearchaeota archaeon]|nr:Type 1 glutamine amidotransferase-like domain-containing protein [Candidatus Woesearchaeota archaeon]